MPTNPAAENLNGGDYQAFKKKIDELVVSNNLSWEKSLAAKQSAQKSALILTPFAIALLVIGKLFDVLDISIPSVGNLIMPLLIGIFAVWLCYQAYKLLLKSRETISPWAMGWIEKALETKKLGKIPNSKVRANLWLGVFFLLIGLAALSRRMPDLMGNILTFGLGAMFIFLGFLGIANSRAWKKPESAFFVLRHNHAISVLFFTIIFLICVAFVVAPSVYYFNLI